MKTSSLCAAALLVWLSACGDAPDDDATGEPDLATITPAANSNTAFFKSMKPSFSCPPPQHPGLLMQHLQTLHCLDPNRAINDCTMLLTSVVNADNQQAAKQFFSSTFTPSEALGLWRDRMRKDVQYQNDSKLRLEVCNGDDDSDLVANARDACPNTRPLRPTDDRGCETTQLPKAPPRQAIDLILGKWGLLYDPRCKDAPIPGQMTFSEFVIPYEVVYLKPSDKNAAGFSIAMNTPQNQPKGCELEYQFRATVWWPDGSEHYGVTTFSSRLSDVKGPSGIARISAGPRDARFWFSKESSVNEEAFSPPSVPKKIGFQVRVMNGAGVANDWSQMYFRDHFEGN